MGRGGVSPEIEENDSILSRLLKWGFPIVIILIAIGVFIFGLSRSSVKQISLAEKVLKDSQEWIPSLVEEWQEVDSYLDDCKMIGYILRQIESTGEYSYRLMLVVPQETEDGFVIVNDAGECWLNGDKDYPRLTDPLWYRELFRTNKKPDAPPRFPFRGLGGLWNIIPFKSRSLYWGVLISQHHD